MSLRPFLCIVALWAAGLAVLSARAGDTTPAFVWNLPRNFPRPRVPATNPMSEAKAELGRHLFYDTRLSGNGTQACSTCHQQERAFTDGQARAVGSTGEEHPRGSMSLVNIGYAAALTWGNPSITRLEDQALVPMFGDHPIELGLEKPGTALLGRLRGEPRYQALFVRAFGSDPDPFSIEHVTQAIAVFERTIVSARSPYDRYRNDRDDTALSVSARRGETLFFSQPLSCFRCHGGFNLSGAVDFEGRREGGMEGVYEVTRKPEDVGKFKAPTLRNIAVTAPYMHDGSAATLENVIAHYAAGGRTVADGPDRGVGHDNPHKSPVVRGFTLDAGQRDDLIAFLRSLTDDALLSDPRFANPWKPGDPRWH